jgi:hypothetical protein
MNNITILRLDVVYIYVYVHTRRNLVKHLTTRFSDSPKY